VSSKKGNTQSRSFEGKRFLITSGPTRAPIDAIRHIANTSTGRLGAFLGMEGLRRGAQVTFICGEGSARPETGKMTAAEQARLKTIPVITFDDLMRVFGQELSGQRYHVILHAMAVLDYVPDVPEKSSTIKMASGKASWLVKLVPTPKLIRMIKRWDPRVFLVGFKLEVGASPEELIRAAHVCAQESGADLVVANELGLIQRGQHQVVIVNAQGRVEATLSGKENIARGLMDLIENRLKGER
jgi:phosphopantothenoylcysteine synthetase/decarboxylase